MKKEAKMHTIAKFLLALALFAFLSACGPANSINTNAAQVTKAAAEIADFELPAGYRPDFTARLMGYTIAAFNPGDGHGHLYLIQSEEETDADKLASMLESLAPGSNDPQTRMTIVETRPVSVHGEEVTLVISEGINSEGESYRQATVAFQGQDGPALLVLSEPVERWEQATVDVFLASIH
jgi:hypothetical protein